MLRSRAVVATARQFARYNSTSSNPEVVNVSLDDKDPEVKNFFSYTWGKWLEGNEQKRKARETRFSLKGLVETLKKDVNSLNKGEELQVKTIMPYHEGKHHKIYRVDLTDGRSYALRIPYSLGHDAYRQARMKSEVATMDFLHKKHQLDLPQVVSWNSSKENPVENEYMIMPFIEGNLLMKQWNPAATDIKAKSSTIKPAVDFLDKMLSTKFNKYGSLYFTEDVATSLQNDLPYNEPGCKLADKYRIGPTTESQFWKGSSADVGAAHRGPFNTVQEYLDASVDVQLAYIQDAIAKGAGSPFPKALEIFERYATVSKQLFPDVEGEIASARLHHPDLSPLNILVGENEGNSGEGESVEQTPYLLDFESTSILPFALHGPPKFVQHKGPKVFNIEQDVPEFEKLPENEKRAIQHFHAQTQNQFAFEFLFRQLSKSDLFPAFLPSLKRRQQLFDTAMSSTPHTSQDLSYDMAMASQEWPYMGLSVDFPAPYSEQEFDQVAQETEEWNKHIMANPFIETKGWLPTDTFDQLVDQGVLVQKDNGDYEYKA